MDMKPLWLIFLLLSLLSLKTTGHGGVDDGDSTVDGADTTPAVDLKAKGLIDVKIWCLVILLVSTFLGGISPYLYRWNESFLLLGTQFAGGVFLGTSLMHFLADSTSTFGAVTAKTYPFSFMLASSGYLLTMLSDCIILFVTQKTRKREAKVESGGSENGGEEEGSGTEVGVDLHPAFVTTTSFEDTILLILALCFHSVFEGIAIGVSGIYTICFNLLLCTSSNILNFLILYILKSYENSCYIYSG